MNSLNVHRKAGTVPVVAVGDPTRTPDGCLAAPADPVEILDVLAGIPEDADVVLLASDPAASAAARSVRLALGEARLGVVDHDVPPTAFYVGATAVTALPDNALGLTPAVLAAVQDSATTRAVVSSVGRLSRPNPSLWQHVAGLWPATRFEVDERAGTVTRVAAGEVVDGRAVIVSSSDPPVQELDERWAHSRVDIPGDGARWGAKRWLETTVLHADLGDLVSQLLTPANLSEYPRCRSCSRIGLLGDCIFCRLPLPLDALSGTPGGTA